MVKIRQIVGEIRDFYQDKAPKMLDGIFLLEPSSGAQIAQLEAVLQVTLPQDYKEFLRTCDFQVWIDGNFSTYGLETIERNWRVMSNHLANGVFDGWVESREIERNYGIVNKILQKCWWSPKWVPFAEDSCGNMKCIDLDPGRQGVVGQIMEMETQDAQGPYATDYLTFSGYVEAQLELLRKGKFVIEEGFLTLDSYL